MEAGWAGFIGSQGKQLLQFNLSSVLLPLLTHGPPTTLSINLLLLVGLQLVVVYRLYSCTTTFVSRMYHTQTPCVCSATS